MDYYKLVGVERNANVEAINAVYRARAVDWHLDPDCSTEEFLHLNAAWLVLSDKESRRRYDEWLTASVHNDGVAPKIAGRAAVFSQAVALLGRLWRAVVTDFAIASNPGGIRKWLECDIAGDSVSGWLFFFVGAIGGELAGASLISLSWPLTGGNGLVACGLIFGGMVAGAELALVLHGLATRIIGGKSTCRTAAGECSMETAVVPPRSKDMVTV